MSERPGLRAAVRALRYRNFRLFWFGALVSNTGTWIQILAVPVVVHELTGSSTLVGVAAFASMAPSIVLAPLAGPLADRIPRRTIIMVVQTFLAVLAATFALLWWGGVREVGVYIALAFVYGVGNGVMMPSWQAFVSELVPRDALLNAVTLNSTQFQATRAMGPAIGGVILAVGGPGYLFATNAVSFAGVLVALAMIKVPRLVPDQPGRIRILDDVRSAARYVRDQPGILRAFKTVVITAVLAQPLVHLMVPYADEVFAPSDALLGLMVASIGIGAVLFFPLVAGWGSFVQRSTLISIALVAYGVVMTVFALAPWYVLAIVALMALGGCHLASASTLNTVIQMQVDERMRGRVMGLYLMTITTGMPVGTLVLGALFDVIGPRVTIVISGLLMLAASLWLIATRRLGIMDLTAPQPQPATPGPPSTPGVRDTTGNVAPAS